jgi:hypothetical protein
LRGSAEEQLAFYARVLSFAGHCGGYVMLQLAFDLLRGLVILPFGLMLAGGGGAGLWYILTKAKSSLHYLVMVISPLQTAAGLILIYKSYDYILRGFGIHLTDWL